MSTISITEHADPGNNRSSEEVQESIYPEHHEINITQGGEFLDDAIRMHEQSFGETNTTELNSPLENALQTTFLTNKI